MHSRARERERDSLGLHARKGTGCMTIARVVIIGEDESLNAASLSRPSSCTCVCMCMCVYPALAGCYDGGDSLVIGMQDFSEGG